MIIISPFAFANASLVTLFSFSASDFLLFKAAQPVKPNAAAVIRAVNFLALVFKALLKNLATLVLAIHEVMRPMIPTFFFAGFVLAFDFLNY